MYANVTFLQHFEGEDTSEVDLPAVVEKNCLLKREQKTQFNELEVRGLDNIHFKLLLEK